MKAPDTPLCEPRIPKALLQMWRPDTAHFERRRDSNPLTSRFCSTDATRAVMHKNKSPGLFEFAARPPAHAVTFGLATGAVLSILAFVGMSLWGADSRGHGIGPTAEGLEQATSAARAHSAEARRYPLSSIRLSARIIEMSKMMCCPAVATRYTSVQTG